MCFLVSIEQDKHQSPGNAGWTFIFGKHNARELRSTCYAHTHKHT